MVLIKVECIPKSIIEDTQLSWKVKLTESAIESGLFRKHFDQTRCKIILSKF